MTDEPDDQAKPLNQSECEEEQELDDRDYTPDFINQILKNPPKPPDSEDSNWHVIFEGFECNGDARAKTFFEYVLVDRATNLFQELQYYQRMKAAITHNQRRPAIESLFRKTHDGAAMEGAWAGLRIAASQSAQKYFDEPSFKAKAGKAFEAAGYPSNAVDAEAFARSLIALAPIERMIASAEKRLLSTMKELERRYAARAPETPVNPLQEAICVQKKRRENKK